MSDFTRMVGWPRLHRAMRAAMALAVLLGLCASTGAPAHAEQRSRNRKKPVRSSALPKSIPEAFHEAVGLARNEGLRVEDARSVDTPLGRYLAVVYTETKGRGQQTMRLYFLPGGTTRVQTGELVDARLIRFGTSADPDSTFLDLNRDGRTEFVFSASNGGNCRECLQVFVYTLEGDFLTFHATEPMVLRDLNGDGLIEMLVEDTRWDGRHGFSDENAPRGTLVYTWRLGGFVFAGPDERAFYEREIDRLRAEMAEAAREIRSDDSTSDDRYVRAALSIYLAHVYMEQGERGREALRRAFAEHVASEAMRREREAILDDFLEGESAKLLERPRRGQQLPKASKARLQ